LVIGPSPLWIIKGSLKSDLPFNYILPAGVSLSRAYGFDGIFLFFLCFVGKWDMLSARVFLGKW